MKHKNEYWRCWFDSAIWLIFGFVWGAAFMGVVYWLLQTFAVG